jgi:uncharacterized protein YcfJ
MKQLLLLSTTLLVSGMGIAQEVGRVISSTPVVQQVGQPRTVCSVEQVTVQPPKSGAGALMGAIAGGAMGNAVGGGGGKAAATMLGIMGGAIVGDNIEGAPLTQTQNVQRCGTQTFYENRTVAYNVVYEYADKQYSVQMPNDPGPSVQLQITPVGSVSQGNTNPPPAIYSRGSSVQPDVVMAQPAYPVYQQPYYPPVSLNLGLGYWGGYYGYRHHH